MIRIVVPSSVFGGLYKKVGNWTFGLLAHTLQCDQRWIFLLRYKRLRFGYRTRGNATPDMLTYRDGGFHWPWKFRNASGRG